MTDIDDEIAELRARLAQLEARRNDEKAAAQAAPAPGAPTVGSGKTNLGLMVPFAIVGIFVLILIAATNQGSKKAAQDQLAQDQEVQAPVAVAPTTISPPAEPTPPPTSAYAWTYAEDVDPMSDRKTLLACVNSTDEVALNPPYDAVTARLCIRNSPKFGVDVYYVLNGDGQILCDSYDGCSVKVRYGDAPAGRNGANTAADHSSNIIFLTGPRAVATRVAKAKVTRVELTFYEAGVQSVTFPTEGLDLTKVNLGGATKKKP
jgi:hypothetical protein